MNKNTKKPMKRGRDAWMQARGYMPISAVAKQCGVTRATVNLWSKKHVESTRVGTRIYLNRKSLAQFLGPEGATMLDAAVCSQRKDANASHTDAKL